MRIGQFGLMAVALSVVLSTSSALAEDKASAKPTIHMLSPSEAKAMKECLDKNGVKPDPNAKPDGPQAAAIAKCYSVIVPPKAEKPAAAKAKPAAKAKKVEEKSNDAN